MDRGWWPHRDGFRYSAADYVDMRGKLAYWDTVRPLFETYSLLLTPSVSVAAFPVGRINPEHYPSTPGTGSAGPRSAIPSTSPASPPPRCPPASRPRACPSAFRSSAAASPISPCSRPPPPSSRPAPGRRGARRRSRGPRQHPVARVQLLRTSCSARSGLEQGSLLPRGVCGTIQAARVSPRARHVAVAGAARSTGLAPSSGAHRL